MRIHLWSSNVKDWWSLQTGFLIFVMLQNILEFINVINWNFVLLSYNNYESNDWRCLPQKQWGSCWPRKQRHPGCQFHLPPESGDKKGCRSQPSYILTHIESNKLSSLSMLRMREAKWDSLTKLWLGIFDFM